MAERRIGRQRQGRQEERTTRKEESRGKFLFSPGAQGWYSASWYGVQSTRTLLALVLFAWCSVSVCAFSQWARLTLLLPLRHAPIVFHIHKIADPHLRLGGDVVPSCYCVVVLFELCVKRHPDTRQRQIRGRSIITVHTDTSDVNAGEAAEARIPSTSICLARHKTRRLSCTQSR